mmetsp:Transcript_26155/g.54608  ORF Transcript_26155/g.54608 Transcript_26155/m.54608 type:complete len:106 (-) Transcript_26155:1852-2169(-)
MSEKTEWETMWGAKVKTPTDMPDDILKDAITTSIEVLSDCGSSVENEDNSKQSAAIQKIKEHMDENWTPSWHVVCGRSFGSLVTHEANRFIYFYVKDKAVMIYKA